MAANQTVYYTSHKGDIDIDAMDEVHVRNVLKKLVRDGLAPEGRVEIEAVDVTEAAKALKALNVAKQAIALMGLSATEEGEAHWNANIDLLSEVQVELSALIQKETKDDDKAPKAKGKAKKAA